MSHTGYQEWCEHHSDSEKEQYINNVLSRVSVGNKYRGTCRDTSGTIFTVQSVDRNYVIFLDGSRVKTYDFGCFYTPYYGV